MQTPLVIAMPKPMADALGYPATPIGFADIVALANDPAGWAKYGHPEWGQFRLGKTNPNFSTSGLNFTVAEYYAATGKTSGLTVEDLNRPDVADFAKSVESAVVHYGDITRTFLNNWFRADARGTALTYTSAVAVEEKSILDYNSGNPDGVLSPGESPRKPKVPLVAIYPKEGTLYSDSPFLVLDADWVTPEQRQAAQLFEDYVQQPENQARVLKYGFRPGNTSVAIGDPIVAANGVDPNEPQNVLDVPEPAVLVKVLDTWERAAQGGAGAARDRRLRLDGRPRQPGLRRHEAGAGPATPPSPPSTSSRTPMPSGCGSSRRTSTRPAPPRSTWSPWRRWTRASGPGSRTRSSR